VSRLLGSEWAEQQTALRILSHAAAIADLLASEWQADGPLRSWHATYLLGTTPAHASIVQTRGASGFQIALVTPVNHDETRSGPGLTTTGAVIWLGLASVPFPLDWRHEL